MSLWKCKRLYIRSTWSCRLGPGAKLPKINAYQCMDISPKDSQILFSKLQNMSYSRSYIRYVVIQEYDGLTMHVPNLTRELHSCQILSLFTFEHILCLLLSLIYPVVQFMWDTAPELCQKGDVFPEKKDRRHFVYVLEYMLGLVSFDKMQNINTLMCKSLKSEGRSFWKLFKSNWFKPYSKILLLTVPRQYLFGG